MTTAVAAHPPAAALARAGLLAIKAGQYRYSTILLTRAVNLDPSLAEAWRWLAALHSGAKRAVCLQRAQLIIPGATIPRLPTPAIPLAPDPAPPAAVRRARRSPWRRVGVVGGSVLLASTLALGGFEFAYADKIYPGVQLFGTSLSGMSAPAAAQALAPTLSAWSEQTILISNGTQGWHVKLGALADFNPATVVAQAYAVGRDGSLPARLGDQGSALLRRAAVQAVPLDSAALGRVFDLLDQQTAQAAQDAAFVRAADGAWAVQPETVGVALDRVAAERQLRAVWAELDWASPPRSFALALPMQTVRPGRTAALLSPLLATLNAQTSPPLVLQADGAEWTFDRANLLDLTTLPAAGGGFRANRSAVQAILRDIAAVHEQPPIPSRLVREGNRAREWRLPQLGRSLDLEAATSALLNSLERADSAAVGLPFAVTAPPPGELEALGITAVVGQGNSQFASYSSPNRDANVVAGGNEFEGLLVAPGDVVSFTGTVGDITADKGYQMGEMISGGVVVPSYGGGICQVSTTLFRAAFWAGLPIEERHNHDWRLAWYEVDAPPGMDATIAIGGPDLKFRNTTPGYLLIDVDTDTVAKTQTITIYGTPRDQQVTLVGPTWNGGGLVITRQILQGGALVSEESWTSYYSQ
jgi:vancomycin resistance protein YoaR